MSSVNNPKVVKQIRAIVKGEYEYFHTYNDPIKGGRRIKFMTNGYMRPDDELADIAKAIVYKLKLFGIQFKSAEWETLESWRGPYDAFIVRI